jgi:hypothetical protein
MQDADDLFGIVQFPFHEPSISEPPRGRFEVAIPSHREENNEK